MKPIGELGADIPASVRNLRPPYLQRQVYLKTGKPGNERRQSQAQMVPVAVQNGGVCQDGKSAALVYAASWWNADSAAKYLKVASQPIWTSLSHGRTELYRDIQQLYLGDCHTVEDAFQSEGPFWGRDYTFWHDGELLTVLHEVFSSSLCQYLS
jgi:chorismate lyase